MSRRDVLEISGVVIFCFAVVVAIVAAVDSISAKRCDEYTKRQYQAGDVPTRCYKEKL